MPTVADRSSEPACVMTFDRDLRLIDLNSMARERLGMGDECIGRDGRKLFPLSWATYAREIVEDALEKGIPAQFQYYGRELGSWFDIRIEPAPEGLRIEFRDILRPAGEQASIIPEGVLDSLAETMRRKVAHIGQSDFLKSRASPPEPAHEPSDAQLAMLAEVIYRDRRRRTATLAIESAEPQWDIVLDLFIQAARNNRISVTSACIASAVPETTALRALEQLVTAGLVRRERDVVDKRRTWVSLTPKGMTLMREFLRQSAMAAGGL